LSSVPPRHLLMLAGLEHGRTIPFSEVSCASQQTSIYDY
jgi:hypothetical protein